MTGKEGTMTRPRGTKSDRKYTTRGNYESETNLKFAGTQGGLTVVLK